MSWNGGSIRSSTAKRVMFLGIEVRYLTTESSKCGFFGEIYEGMGSERYFAVMA